MRIAAGLLGITVVLPLSPSTAAGQPAERPGPRVKLLTPGKPPLRALRYKASVGSKGRMAMGTRMAMEVTMGGMAMPSTPVPEIRTVMEYEVTRVDPAGDIRYEFRFVEAEVADAGSALPAPAMADLRERLKKMSGMRGHSVVDTRGLVKDTDVTVAEDADPQLRQMVESMRQSVRQISAPFPEEAVGVGARWETTMQLSQGGLTVDQAALSELTSLTGDKGQLSITLTQKAPPQQMKADNLPPGARIDLTSFESSGSGATEFDLRQLVAVRGEIKMHNEMTSSIRIGEGQPPQSMEMKMDMTITISSNR